MTPMKLGKLPARHDKRTLQFAKYNTGFALKTLSSAHWGHGLPFTMLGNDQYGDCVEAEFAHQLQIWITRAGGKFTPDSTNVLGAYSALTGFNPNVPGTDRGTDMLSACNYWRSTGMNGFEIDSFLEVNPLIRSDVQDCIAYYGGLDIGIQMPLSAQAQSSPTGKWHVTSGPSSVAGSWGGHCVVLCGYDAQNLYAVTWGYIQSMTWQFFQTYCDEAFVMLAHEWIENTGASPGGIAWGKLMADMANLGK